MRRSIARRQKTIYWSSIGLLLLVTIAATGCQMPQEPSEAQDWPNWRGPGWMGISDAETLPTQWSTTKHVLWKFEDPGFGHSSPIVWKDALFMTTAQDDTRLLLRLNASTGKEVWRVEVFHSPLEGKHQKNSHASSTPATDGERIYVTFLDAPHVVVSAYDFLGKMVWTKTPGEFHSQHGFCSTPVVFEDLVIVNCDQDAEDSYIVAFDRRTGAIRWRTHRENQVRSYCPPIVFDIDGSPQLILSGSDTVCSYNPRTGERNWVLWGPTEQCVASVVYDGSDNVFVTGGYPDHFFLCIDPRGTGNVTESNLRWKHNRGVSYVPSPLYWGGHYYVVSDDGILSVLDAKTGDYKLQKRLEGDYSASLVYGAGHIYCCSEDGKVTIVRATPELKTVAEIDMEDPIYASPAIAQGRLYLRTWERLYCIGSGAQDDTASPVN